jgi:hypothetical protein
VALANLMRAARGEIPADQQAPAEAPRESWRIIWWVWPGDISDTLSARKGSRVGASKPGDLARGSPQQSAKIALKHDRRHRRKSECAAECCPITQADTTLISSDAGY